MKHFAHVYLMAPKGVVRSMLAEDQRKRLVELTRTLEELAHGKLEYEITSLRGTAWHRALRRFCGFA